MKCIADGILECLILYDTSKLLIFTNYSNLYLFFSMNSTNDFAMENVDLNYLCNVFKDFDESLIIKWNEEDTCDKSLHQISLFKHLNRANNLVEDDNTKLVTSFQEYVEQLRLRKIADITSCERTRQYLLQDGLVSLILCQRTYDRKLSNQVVKLHDIVSNAFNENITVEYLLPVNIVKHVMKSLLFCHLILCLRKKDCNETCDLSDNTYAFLSPTLGSSFANYSYYDDVLKKFVNALSRLCVSSNLRKGAYVDTSELIANFSSAGREGFFKAVLKHSEDSEMVAVIVKKISKESHESLYKILLSRSSFGSIDSYRRLICFLNRLSLSDTNNETMGIILIKIMQAWADPIIAKAHVFAEIVHYTQLVFVIFYHFLENKQCVQNYQQKVVEQIAKGLPNHLNSTDFRTITLAKMMCEIITESLKFCRGTENNQKLNEFSIKEYFDDQLCRKVLECYQGSCCKSAACFWMSKYILSNVNSPLEQEKSRFETLNISSTISVDSDDDDDDDLEPIESMDVPENNEKTKIVYIRDYLEKLPELKTYDDNLSAFKALQPVIKHQLKYDHVQVGKDLLDAVFRWENDFDQPLLDEYRKNNLCTILQTKTESNVEHFCNYFHGITQLQPYKKNLILDVLSTVSKELPLKQLGTLANAAFDNILYDENCIKAQDVTVRIPLILFFSNLLSNTLPKIMVREQMVVSYLKCLTRIEGESASTEQAALYAINSLVGALEGFQFSENVQSSISDTRTWLCRLKNLEINHL